MDVWGGPGPLTLEMNGHPLELCCPSTVAPPQHPPPATYGYCDLNKVNTIKIPFLSLGSHISDAQWVVQTWKVLSITESSVGQRPLVRGAHMGLCDFVWGQDRQNQSPVHLFHFPLLLFLPQLPKIW